MNIAVPMPFEEALEGLRSRGIMPTGLSSAQIRGLDATIRQGAIFSARTTHARYVQEIKDAIDKILSGKLSKSEAKEILLRKLDEYGYDPSRGFPGDRDLGIPPAELGSLRDLGSSRRLDLILETQLTLHRSMGQKAQGTTGEALYDFPCWELVRMMPRRIPRGSAASSSPGWPERWEQCGGEFYRGRMIARKDSPVWAALGDSSRFDDALDVDVPPFAFNSGFSWLEISREEAVRLGALSPEEEIGEMPASMADEIRASVRGIDTDILQAALKGIRAEIEEDVARLAAKKGGA